MVSVCMGMDEDIGCISVLEPVVRDSFNASTLRELFSCPQRLFVEVSLQTGITP